MTGGPRGGIMLLAGKPTQVSVRILFIREIKLPSCYNKDQAKILNVFVKVV